MSVEKEFLQKVFKSPDEMNQAIKFRVSKDLILDSTNKKLYEIALWFFQKYTNIISADSLKIVLDKSKLAEDVRQKIFFLYTELQSAVFENRATSFLIDTLRDDFKKHQVKDLLITSVNSFEASNIDQAIVDLKQGIIKIELNSRSETREGFIHESTKERGDYYYDVKMHPEKYRGIYTGWPSFDNTTGGVRGGQLMVIIGMIKSGKCIKGDSLLFTEKGFITLDDVQKELKTSPKEWRPYNFNLYSKEGEVKTSYFYNAGVKNTLKIKTRFGYELEGTPEHPILVIDENCDLIFKKLSELKISDYICIQRGQNYWGNNTKIGGFKFKKNTNALDLKVPYKLTKKLARFFGYLVSEGYAVEGGSIYFTNSNIEVVEDMQRCTLACFGLSWKYVPQSKGDYTIHSVKLVKFLSYCGYKLGLSDKKEIPQCILTAPKRIVIEFLRAYFEGDGIIESSQVIGCYSKSKKLMDQLQIVLSNLGIICKKGWQRQRATNTEDKIYRKYWRLTLNGLNNLIFAQQIGFTSSTKKENLKKFIKKFLNRRRKSNVDVIPFLRENLVETLLHHQQPRPFTKASLPDNQLKFLRDLKFNPTKQVTYTILPRILNIKSSILQKEKIRRLQQYNFFYDRITYLKKSKAQVYDFTVPEGHNFTSNCFISHNSCALLNIGYHASAIQHKNVLYISVEMKKEQVERRYDARDSGLSYSKIRDGRLSDSEEEIYNNIREAQKNRPGKFYIVDEAICSVAFIKSKITTLPFKTDLVIIDYLSILQATTPGKDNWKVIGDLTVEVRDIAREFNIPIITAAQANREGLKEAKFKFGIENIGLSHLISAHADTLLSLRIADPDELEVNDVVEMNAATIAIRDDRGCRFTIDAHFDKMLLKERQLVLASQAQPLPPIPGVTSYCVP